MLTKFEKQVLEAVRRVPRGKLVTYKQIAKIIKKPQAQRAVGNALEKNPYPIKIPCHRVIRADGKIGGHKWGETKKIELLKKEGIKIRNGKVVEWR